MSDKSEQGKKIEWSLDFSKISDQLNDQLKSWGVDLEQMTKRADDVSSSMRGEYEKALDELRERLKEAQARLEEARKRGDAVSDDVVTGFKHAWESLRAELEKAVQQFGGKADKADDEE